MRFEGPKIFGRIKWLTPFQLLSHHFQQTGKGKSKRMNQHEKAVGPLAGRLLERCWFGSSDTMDLVASGSSVITRRREAAPTSFRSAISTFFQSALELLRLVDPMLMTAL
jgi:hypothetical protein